MPEPSRNVRAVEASANQARNPCLCAVVQAGIKIRGMCIEIPFDVYTAECTSRVSTLEYYK